MKFFIILSLLFNISLFAQEGVSTFSLGIGQTFLSGKDFPNYGDDKLTFDFFYNYSPADSDNFDLLLNVHSHEFQNNNKRLRTNSFNMNVKYKLHQGPISPFVNGGLGFYHIGLNDGLQNDIVLGNTLGLGVDFQLNQNFHVGFTLQHHNPFDADMAIDRTIEGSYNKMMFMIGVSF